MDATGNPMIDPKKRLGTIRCETPTDIHMAHRKIDELVEESQDKGFVLILAPYFIPKI